MKTPEEYYNRKSKQDSAAIAGVCFIVIMLLALGAYIYNLINL